MLYDIIVIGAGPAGITAGVYAARKRMKLVVVTIDIGGQTALSGEIENYTGYQFISGPELTEKFEEHLKQYDIELKQGERVTGLEKRGGIVRVTSDAGEYEGKTLVIASGKRPRELGVPGEKEFRGRGVTYCATCDGPLFAGKDVVIIGGGNSGLDAALQMIRMAKHVYLVEVAEELRGDPIMREKVTASDRTTVLTGTRVKEVAGEKFVSGITVESKDGEKTIPVQGVFVEIGLIPNSQFARGVEKNEAGEIKVTPRNETNVPGVFAAGDVTDVPEKQIIVAAGEGAKAAITAFRYLSKSSGESWY